MASLGQHDRYFLPRDSSESARLAAQHKIWMTNIGYVLNPHVASHLPSDARIADVGTGTGIWLRDLAAENESKQYSYQGFDVNDSQLAENLPRNFSFALLDILETVPHEWRGKFDVVHAKLLTCGLAEKDWSTAAENMLQLLKPGGWLQWSEGANVGILRNVSAPHKSANSRLLERAFSAATEAGRLLKDGRDVAKVVANAGFAKINDDTFASDRVVKTRLGFSQVSLGAFVGNMKAIARASGDVERENEAEKNAKQCREELARGEVYFRADLHVVTARKPI